MSGLSREMGLETWGIPYDEEIERMLDGAVRERIVSEMKGLGFRYVTLDLQGYRTGSMNEVL